MQYYNMSQTIGAGMEPRFYINGRRVSRDKFDYVQMRARQLPGGKIRRINYCLARY